MSKIDSYSRQLEDVYRNLENEIISMFIDKLNSKKLDADDFNIYQWHLEQLNQFHQLNNATIDKLSKATGVSKKLINRLIKDSGYDIANTTSNSISHSLNTDTLPVSSDVDAILSAMVKQAYSNFDNYVNQSLVTDNYGNSTLYDSYQSILNDMISKVVSGVKTPRDALNSAIYNFMDTGLMSGFTDKAGRNWSLSSYIRMLLDTTKYRVMNEARMGQAHEYGLHTFLMSSHPKSRPACAYIQGHVVNDVPRSDPAFDRHFPTIYDYDYGEPGGTFGINCHHMKYPFIPGVNINNQPQYDPEEAIRNGNLTQKQRQIERAIRNSKDKLNVAERLGDLAGINRYKALIRKQQGGLRQYINDNTILNRDYSREKGYNRAISKAEKQAVIRRSKINKDTNNRHVEGTHEYNEKTRIRKGKGLAPSSILTIDHAQAQRLIELYGVRDMTTRITRFRAKFVIGYYIDQKTGVRYATRYGKITYSKSGAHITPMDPRRR